MTSEDLSNCRMGIYENSPAAIHFFDEMCLDPSQYKHDEDFLMIREKPLLKTGPRIYNFIFMKFFLDKAFTGLLFDMKDALVRRGVLDAQKGYMDLRTLLGEEFSERFFFYALMKKCFGQRYTRYSGQELEKKLGWGMPDYYMRRGNRVFLFECKDAQLASRIKLSGDYNVIKDALFDKYVRNSKGHSKGVSQLVAVVSEKLSLILDRIDNTALRGIVYVFPVIVYFDDCFGVEGASYLLNKEFWEMMNTKEIDDRLVVKDVVMVNIEQFMRLENFFANDRLKLATVINSYIDYKNREELNSVFPFNKFLFQEARKKGYNLKRTKWFDEIYKDLVTMDSHYKLSE